MRRVRGRVGREGMRCSLESGGEREREIAVFGWGREGEGRNEVPLRGRVEGVREAMGRRQVVKNEKMDLVR